MMKTQITTRCLSFFPFFALLFVVQCVGPVDTQSPDLIEFESVWQYLKTYSIYQWEDSSRVPDDPFAYASPELLLQAVGDTLKGIDNNYTRYEYYSVQRTDFAEAATEQIGGTTVFLSKVTDSTVQIEITGFVAGITYNEFLEILPLVMPFSNIIVDLRGNGGGDIVETDSIIEAFLPAGMSYISARERSYNQETRVAQTKEWHFWKTVRSARLELAGKNIVILMNDGSASASEILIAALKDCANATLIGTRTYGKGIGQIELVRRDRRALKITFLQLRGVSSRIGVYHRIGIVPDRGQLGKWGISSEGSSSDTSALRSAMYLLEPSATSYAVPAQHIQNRVDLQHEVAKVVYEEQK